MKNRRVNIIRRWLGGLCQTAAWFLLDPNDRWLVDYQIDGKRYCETVHGVYRMARVKAKELHGSVVGWSVQEFRA